MKTVGTVALVLLWLSGLSPAVCAPSTGETSQREAALFGGNSHSDEVDREAQLFGGESPVPPPNQAQGIIKPDNALNGRSQATERLEARLRAKDDTLKLGGRLYLRSTVLLNEDRKPDEINFRSAALLYTYADARPNRRVRMFIKGRFDHVLSGIEDNPAQTQDAINLGFNERTRARIDQLWLKFDAARKVFFTVGQQPIRWGTGRIWNPTDFVNAQMRDPLAIFDARPGVSLLKVHLPFEGSGTNVYAIAQFDGAQKAHDVGGVFRLEQTLGPTETSVSVSIRDNQPLRLGSSFSGGLGPFELKGEYALIQGKNQTFFKGDFDLSDGKVILPEKDDKDDEWLSQAVAGLEWGIAYGDNDTLFITAEYFFNSAGYDNPNIYPWLITQNAFNPLYVGRHYAGLNIALPRPGGLDDSTFILSGISNLSDKSIITRFDYQQVILTQLSIYFFASVHTGEKGEFRFGFDLPKNPEFAQIARESGLGEAVAEQLDKGIHIPAQWLNIGVWLSLPY